MRLRLASKPPLPPLKIWYSINSSESLDAPSTIYELKEQLCSRVFKNAAETTKLMLSLDNFELLDDSDITVLRDGDLVCASYCQSENQAGVKRKGEMSTEDNLLPNKKLKRANAPSKPLALKICTPPVVTPSASSSSESSSSESSSSESSSSSDSEASDSPSSEESSEEEESLVNTGPKLPKSVPPPVPPGYGKPSTRSRNQRRRIKKKYDQVVASGSQVSKENGTPSVLSTLSTQGVRDEDESTGLDYGTPETTGPTGLPSIDQPPMMTSLRNKNKKKGFYSLNQRPIPPRIIFAEDGTRVVQSGLHPQGEPINTARPPQTPRLITPAEKQERGQLPSHMFVTSVDVEDGMWGKKKNRKQPKNVYPMTVPSAYEEPVQSVLEQVVQEVTEDTANAFDFEAAENHWESLPALEKTALKVGAVLVWKELAINPQTFTPEMLLMAARLTNLDDNTVIIKHILRPGSEELSFGGLQDTEGEMYTTTLEGDKETFTWEAIAVKGCKILGALQVTNI